MVRSTAGEPARRIRVALFGDAEQWRDAELLQRREAPPRDLAVLRLRIPGTFQVAASCLAPSSDDISGREVWFIGRDEEWQIPALPGRINVRQPNIDHQLSFDVTGVRPGTSGAPLLSEEGLMGMVTEDTGLNEARALAISYVHQRFQDWGLPWSLPVCRLWETKTAEGIERLPSCEGPANFFGGRADCTKSTATRKAVCARIPADAVIQEIRLYRKWEDDTRPWDQVERRPNEDLDWCMFEGEAKISRIGHTVSVCWDFLQWSSHQTRLARITVRYQAPTTD